MISYSQLLEESVVVITDVVLVRSDEVIVERSVVRTLERSVGVFEPESGLHLHSLFSQPTSETPVICSQH